MTQGKNARAVYDAVEQARVEAVGARRMGGVARNLAAMLEDRYHRGNYQEVTDRAVVCRILTHLGDDPDGPPRRAWEPLAFDPGADRPWALDLSPCRIGCCWWPCTGART